MREFKDSLSGINDRRRRRGRRRARHDPRRHHRRQSQVRIAARAARPDRRARPARGAERVLRRASARATARRSCWSRPRTRAASPLRFEIDPQELLRVHDRLDEDGLEVGAIYHSHTRTEPYPSQTDINFAVYARARVDHRRPGGRGARRARVPDRRRRGESDGARGRVSQALLCPACETPHGADGALLPRLRHAARARRPEERRAADRARRSAPARSAAVRRGRRWCGSPRRATRPRPS